jgi:hypothetical protein
VLQGDLGPDLDVQTQSQKDCGVELAVGDRTGLFLRLADDGDWQSDLCMQIDPDSLIAAAGASPGAPVGDVPPEPSPRPLWPWLAGGMALAVVASLAARRLRRGRSS